MHYHNDRESQKTGVDLSHISLAISLLCFAALVIMYFNAKAGLSKADSQVANLKTVFQTPPADDRPQGGDMRSILVRLANIEGLERRLDRLEGRGDQAKEVFRQTELALMTEHLLRLQEQMDAPSQERLAKAIALLNEVRAASAQ